MRPRAHISLQTKLAAAVAQILALPHEHAMAMTEEQVLSLVQFDHYPRRKADGGEDAHFNLRVRPIPEHREKTAKIDVPQIAKSRRLRADQEQFRARLLAKQQGEERKPSKWPSRPFSQRKRKPKRRDAKSR